MTRKPTAASLPRTYTPQLATLARTPPEGPEWLHERASPEHARDTVAACG